MTAVELYDKDYSEVQLDILEKPAWRRSKPTSLISVERIERSILLIRGHKVLLDADLARLYGVETKAFNQAVKRNLDRFPADFMFQLTQEELEEWR